MRMLIVLKLDIWLLLLFLGTSIGQAQTLTLGATFRNDMRLQSLDNYTEFEVFTLKNTSCRLVEYTQGSYEPGLAASWSVSSDGLVYLFRLRDDARYTDDSMVTADHVAYTIKRHIYLGGQLSSKVKTTIVGGQHLKSPWQEIEGIKVEAPFLLKIRLTRPYPAILEDLSFLTMSVFKPSDVYDHVNRIKPTFSSCGPYYISKFDRSEIRLRLRSDHWKVKGQKGLFSEVRVINKYGIDAFESKLIDSTRGSGDDFNRIQKKRPDIKKMLVSPMFRFLSINAKGPLNIQYPQLSRLLNTVIDRQLLVRGIPHDPDATPSPIVHFNNRSIVEKASSFFSPEDIEKAKNEIKEIVRHSKKKLKLSLGAYRSNLIPILQTLKKQIEPLGIEVNMILFPRSFYGSPEHMKNYDFVLVHEIFDNINPGEFLPFLAGASPKWNNLPSDHELFQFYDKLPSYYETGDWTGAVMSYNALNRRYGFIVPLYITSLYELFSERVDVSHLSAIDDNWTFDQIRFAR